MPGRIVPRFDFRVDVGHASVTGKVRQKNEDAVLLAPELSVFGIADGMGGLAAGEVASREALEVVKQRMSLKATQRAIETYVAAPTLEHRRGVFAILREACEEAHLHLVREQERMKAMMGTTLDVCLLARDKAFVAHVGDGRVYLVRPRATLQLTEDHLAREPASFGSGPRARAPRPLVSGLGLPSPLRVDVCVVELRKGDTLTLMTDGAYAPLGDEASVAAAFRGPSGAAVDQVMRQSLAKGGKDNATVIALRVEDRLVQRAQDAGSRLDVTDDLVTLKHCPLLVGLSPSSTLAALSSGIEVELESGHEIPRFEAGDHCAYVVLSGVVKVGEATLGPPALLFAESLVGVEKATTAVVVERARCLRVRRDDFREVAEHDPMLGLSLYQRLAGHLARAH